ncbi:unnamed protein product [Mesocestoides corti]|uniref:Major facilitator superfamily (MFS) profile domain-containing protein n=1 Tax=Mesocestoides corti TaxID=53468 RepID=A0A0R3UP56_MESCO|nr:unnamed protein product [Mesocestoides corti]
MLLGRGFILGAWNSHVSLGNILGALLAGACVEVAWGWSFVVPGLVVGGMGVLVYFFLVPYPEDMGFTLPESTAKPSPSEFARNDGDYSNLQVSMHPSRENMRPISFCAALAVPGVMEYSLCLFFVKSVAYTFLFWLPMYIREANGLEAALSADLSAIFDSGGIVGGMLAGLITDRTSCSATICGAMLLVAVPTLYAYYLVGASSVAVCICMLLSLGILVVGPYSLITTVVSADLGTDQSLQGNTKALSTVVAIIDGMGSLGAAAGPFIVGLIVGYGWLYIFLVMMLFLILSILFLLRRIVKELQTVCRPTVAYVQMP